MGWQADSWLFSLPASSALREGFRKARRWNETAGEPGWPAMETQSCRGCQELVQRAAPHSGALHERFRRLDCTENGCVMQLSG